ncbi:MAG: SUMF1/EgtB/PvdO family nonheme iron enzyme [Terriglobia bacterium]
MRNSRKPLLSILKKFFLQEMVFLIVWTSQSSAFNSDSQASVAQDLMPLTFPGRTVHNSHYLSAAFFYHIQTLIGTSSKSPNVMKGEIIKRRGKNFWLDLTKVPQDKVVIFRQIAARTRPFDELSLDEIQAYLKDHYYELTRPYPSLQALLREYPFSNNPNWLEIPVDSATFSRRRVLHISKDRIADALITYFNFQDRMIFPEGTVIVAESMDKNGGFVDAEVLRKRGDGFWNFAVYNAQGKLVQKAIAFDEEGEPAPEKAGFIVPNTLCPLPPCRPTRFVGRPRSPVLSPVRGYFDRLPSRVPQIHLGPEYYDHMAFTELTEANGKVKDGVFGVYGSLLLSELTGRKRLNRLTPEDTARYLRLQPYYPELLTSLDRVDSVINSIGIHLMRIPASTAEARIGSRKSDPEHRPDEERHRPAFQRSFFLSDHVVTNAEYRRFSGNYHSPAYRGVGLDGDDYPAVNLSYEEVQSYLHWLNSLPAERQAGRTYRLPTEQEWELAAKGEDDRRFPWGDQWPPPEGAGNFGDESTGTVFTTNWPIIREYRDGYVATSPVGKFFPNPYFLYDMAGNVYEWTSSSYDRYPNAPPAEKSYGSGWRVIRGSSWADELPKVLRCAFRNPVAPNTRMVFLGFRLAADIPGLH